MRTTRHMCSYNYAAFDGFVKKSFTDICQYLRHL